MYYTWDMINKENEMKQAIWHCADCGEVYKRKDLVALKGKDGHIDKIVCEGCIEQYNQAPSGSYGASLE